MKIKNLSLLILLLSTFCFSADHRIRTATTITVGQGDGHVISTIAEVAVLKGMAVSLDNDGTNELCYPAYSNNPANTMVSGIALTDAQVGDTVNIQVDGIAAEVLVTGTVLPGSTLAVYSSAPGKSTQVGQFLIGDTALVVGTAITNPVNGYVSAVLSFSVLPSSL